MDEKISFNGQSVIEVIKKRTSVRSYKNKPIQDDIKEKLIKYFESIKGPFDARVRFMLIESKMKHEPIKLGTYGVIKNAPMFITAAVEKNGMYIEQLGYQFEKAVLYATSLGLGTCWLGGTFKKSEFTNAASLKGNEELPIVSPVGYPEDDKRLLEKLMRLVAGSKNRKGWEELFFNRSFAKTLTNDDADRFAIPLEMVRLAPSASNKQPWRIVMDKQCFHFYLQHTKGYVNTLGFDMQKVDMGIAMCHFELSAKEIGIEGNWVLKQPDTLNVPQGTEYIASFQVK